GVSPLIALLNATPCTAPASATANCRISSAPAGTPAGQAAQDTVTEPTASVASGRMSATGTVTSVPPLKGVGFTADERNIAAGADGAASASVMAPLVPATSEPL